MDIFPGVRFGPYEIVSALGAGGMGEVYRARDTKLDRDVAIKILPEAFARDADRLARFQREAKTLASLNHPNIAVIHGLEHEGDVHAIVMELVEGDDLSQRIARGAIPIGEALPIARQTAEALEAAHEQGIVHRDLKPANIRIRLDGTVKVLDFGLAKSITGGALVSEFATALPGGTREGAVLGTPGYMSPEQTRGAIVDKRTDVWAFGCVLYEMLAGRPAFATGTASDSLVAILSREPDWTALPAATSLPIRRLLQRSLTKDVRRRLQAIGEARAQIEEETAGASEGATLPESARAPQRFMTILVTALVTGAAVAAIMGWDATRRPQVNAGRQDRVVRFDIVTPPTDAPTSFALSDDGTQLAFVANTESGSSVLWLRALGETTARPLAGTENAEFPFWSPDGTAVGFFADGQLKRVEAAGGLPQVLAKASSQSRGGTWSRDNVILFAPFSSSGLFRVSATGGTTADVIRAIGGKSDVGPRWPHFLPDGRRFLFFVTLGGPDVNGTYIGALGEDSPRRIRDTADVAAGFAPPDTLLTVRQSVLFAQRLTFPDGVVTGDPVRIADAISSELNQGAFSASSNGVLAYRAGLGAQHRQLQWVDRSGRVLQVITPVDQEGAPGDLDLAPNGRQVVVQRALQGNIDIWLTDVDRGVWTRVTTAPGLESTPIWSPDGTRVVFNSNRNGALDLYEKVVGSGNPETLLLATSATNVPLSWSPDGRFLLYSSPGPSTGVDLWVLPLTGERKPFTVVQTGLDEDEGQFSPDGRWLAFGSWQSGRSEVYVRPFPEDGTAIQVSTAGGSQVRWRRDGRELYYVAPDGRLMAVTINTGADGRSIKVGAPVPLFPTRLAAGNNVVGHRPQYAVAPDGRFLLDVRLEELAPPITVVLNWDAAWKRP